jgi:hypothetical protein
MLYAIHHTFNARRKLLGNLTSDLCWRAILSFATETS